MAIVINGSGTVTGLAVGGLPDGTVDSDTLASGIDKTSITDSGDATAITITSAENVGIGTTSPDGTLHAQSATAGSVTASTNADDLVIENGASGGLSILVPDTSYANFYMGHPSDNDAGRIQYGSSNVTENDRNNMLFSTAGTERMRIDSSGTVSFHGRSGRVTSSTGGLSISSQTDSRSFVEMGSLHTGTSYLVKMLNNNGEVGSITTNGSGTAFNTSSDYRLKENVDYTWDATTRLKQLKPARFNFIADDTTTVDGFIAHEVSSVVPEAISGTKDAMTAEVLYVEGDELPEGKVVGDVKTASVPDMQGIDQSKLVPLLVKTIQELEARITALEA